MMTAEQMIAAQKANIETLFGLTEKAFSGVEKMVELNMAAAKAAIADSQSQAHAFMNVKDVQELMALQAGYLQPLSEKAVAFSRHVYDIASNTSKEFGHAFEEKAAEAQNSVVGLVDSVSKNAPAGSESAVAMMKSKAYKKRSSKPPKLLKPICTPWLLPLLRLPSLPHASVN